MQNMGLKTEHSEVGKLRPPKFGKQDPVIILVFEGLSS